jgi:hypothetical protein
MPLYLNRATKNNRSENSKKLEFNFEKRAFVKLCTIKFCLGEIFYFSIQADAFGQAVCLQKRERFLAVFRFCPLSKARRKLAENKDSKKSEI